MRFCFRRRALCGGRKRERVTFVRSRERECARVRVRVSEREHRLVNGVSVCGVISGEVYISGGFSTSDRAMTSVERYSPQGNTWSLVAAMPTAIRGHVVVKHDFVYMHSEPKGIFSSRSNFLATQENIFFVVYHPRSFYTYPPHSRSVFFLRFE